MTVRRYLNKTIIIIAILAGAWMWTRYFRRWMERRIGIFLPRAVRPPKRSKFRSAAAVWGALLLAGITIGFLRRNTQQFRPDGWMEQAAGTWLCLAVVFCLRRVFDSTNLLPRRIWNGITAGVLLLAYSFLGTSPKSYAEILVLLGFCYLGLALLDVGLLLHLAVRQLPKMASMRMSEDQTNTGVPNANRLGWPSLPYFQPLLRRTSPFSRPLRVCQAATSQSNSAV